MENVIETRGLRRCFGEFTAVDGIDLAVPAGSLYGFLGPNGAGKSTTIKCLTGLLRPTFAGRIHGLSKATIRERAKQLLELMDLEAAAGSLVADYSHGMKKKLSLATALLPGPRLLFLDEPFEGIDVVASRQIKTLLQGFVERGGTVFLTSHVLEIVERLADHVAVINKGRIVGQGTLDELRSSSGNDGQTLEQLFLQLVGAEDEALDAGFDWLGG